jgi:hypothetical protein
MKMAACSLSVSSLCRRRSALLSRQHIEVPLGIRSWLWLQLVWPVHSPQVLPCPQLIFPSKNLVQKSLKNKYLPHSESNLTT